MCILLYLKLIQCSGIPKICGQLDGVYIYTGYMCILLYVKHIWCSGIPMYLWSIGGGGLGICAFCSM